MSTEALKSSKRLSMKSSRSSYSRKDSEESLGVLNFLIGDETYRSSLEYIDVNTIELNENNCFPNDENDVFCDENHVTSDDVGAFPSAIGAVAMSTPKPFYKHFKKFEFSEALQLEFNYPNELLVDNECDKRLSVIVETSDILSQSKSIHSNSNILSPQHVSLNDKLSIADNTNDIRENFSSPTEHKLNKTVTFSTNSNECGLNKTVTLPNDANSNGEGKLNKTMTFSNNCMEDNNANKDFNKVREDMLGRTFDKKSLEVVNCIQSSSFSLPEKNGLDRILEKFNSAEVIAKSIDETESAVVLDAAAAATPTDYVNETFEAIPMEEKVASFLNAIENHTQDTAIAEEFLEKTDLNVLNATQNINSANKTFSNEPKSDISELPMNEEVEQSDNEVTKFGFHLTVDNTLNDLNKFSTAPCKLLSQNIPSLNLQNGIEAKYNSNLISTFHVNLETHPTKQTCALGSSLTACNKFTSKIKPVGRVEHGLAMGNGNAKLYGRYSLAPRSDFQKSALPGFKLEDRLKRKRVTNLENLNTTFEGLPKKLANTQKESKQISSNKAPTKNPKSMMNSTIVNNQNARAFKSNGNVLPLKSKADLHKYETMPSKVVPGSKYNPKFDKKGQTDFKALSKATHNTKENIPLNSSHSNQRKNSTFGVSTLNISKNLGAKPKTAIKPEGQTDFKALPKITHNIKENIPLNSSHSNQRRNSNFGVSSLNIPKNLGAKPKIAIKPEGAFRKSSKPVFKHANAVADLSKKKYELNQITKPSSFVRKEPAQKKTELGRPSHSQKMLVEIPKDSQEPIIDQQRRPSLLPKPKKSFLPKPCHASLTVKKDRMQK